MKADLKLLHLKLVRNVLVAEIHIYFILALLKVFHELNSKQNHVMSIWVTRYSVSSRLGIHELMDGVTSAYC